MTLLIAACADDPARRTIIDPRAHPSLVPRRTSPVQPSAQPKTDNVKTYGLKGDQVTQRLLTANTFLQSGDSQAAQQTLDLINQAELSVEQRSQFALIQAQIDLSMGDAERALVKLDLIRPRLLADNDKIDYYQSLAFAQALHGDLLASVSARIRLGSLLTKPEQQQANIVAILDLLGTMPSETLNAPAVVNDELEGWLSLARILKQRDQAGIDLADPIQQWRLAHPGHPANAEFLQRYLAAPQPAAEPGAGGTNLAKAAEGPAIAVLLPTSGAYAAAGKAVKEGLQAAYRLAASAAPQQALRFYDTAKDDIGNVYRQAVSEGATLIIGPLVKEQVQELISNNELTIPVLALNQIDGVAKPNLYQFGLSPIDEAEQLALKALRDGGKTAMILVPSTPLGQRVGHYLMTAWQERSGVVTDIQNYDPRQHDIGNKLSAMLSSPANAQTTVLLLSATPDMARELAPQIRYHQGGAKLDVYAMPTIYGGRQNPAQDAELGAITFCDIPWFFSENYSGALSQAAMQPTWQGMPDSVMRLVALGIDAFNIHNQLPQLATTVFSGATGRLALGDGNRITRKLVCAQLRGGVPVASGFVE